MRRIILSLLYCRKYLAIILCCSFGVPAIIIICTVCVVHRVRRRRLAQLQARNREIAAEHLTTLFILSSLRQQEARATGEQQIISDKDFFDIKLSLFSYQLALTYVLMYMHLLGIVYCKVV